MGKKVLVIIFLTTILMLTSCSRKENKINKKNILFSFKPYSYVISDLAEDHYKTDFLFQDEKDFQVKSLSKAQMKKIKKADLIVLNGYIEDPFVTQLDPYKDKIVYVSQMINQVKINVDKKHPYFWLNQDLYMDYAKGLNARLGEINPYYRELYNKKILELDEKDSQLLGNYVTKNISDQAFFDQKIIYLQEYFKDHQLTDPKSKNKAKQKIGSSKDDSIQIDVWGEKEYSGMFDYFEKNYKQILD